MKKEMEMTFEDLQKYKKLQECLFPLVKSFIKHTAINKEDEYHIEAVYAHEYELSVFYICINDPYMGLYKQYHMNISYDSLLEYIESCNKEENKDESKRVY